MRCPAAPLLLVVAAATASAATAYVSDELVLGVYTEQNGQGQRLATLHSGAAVETLSASGEFTQVRLNEGITGWVKSAYLTPREPATVRIKQLEAELDRSRATTPALAEAAARSEAEQLKRELQRRSELDSAARAPVEAPGRLWAWIAGMVLALACGFALGYGTLAQRVKHKFGGLRVY